MTMFSPIMLRVKQTIRGINKRIKRLYGTVKVTYYYDNISRVLHIDSKAVSNVITRIDKKYGVQEVQYHDTILNKRVFLHDNYKE